MWHAIRAKIVVDLLWIWRTSLRRGWIGVCGVQALWIESGLGGTDFGLLQASRLQELRTLLDLFRTHMLCCLLAFVAVVNALSLSGAIGRQTSIFHLLLASLRLLLLTSTIKGGLPGVNSSVCLLLALSRFCGAVLSVQRRLLFHISMVEGA